MAKLVEQVPEWLGSPPTLVRFCGTTGQSSSTRDLLVSLCKQICHITDQSDKELPDVSVFEGSLHFLHVSVGFIWYSSGAVSTDVDFKKRLLQIHQSRTGKSRWNLFVLACSEHKLESVIW